MTTDKNDCRITCASVLLLTLSVVAQADTGSSKAMQAQINSESAAATSATMASAFEADMQQLAEASNTASATNVSSAPGADGRVIGMTGIKMLMVKKNEDGTHTISHVSSDAESVEKFLQSDNAKTEEK